MALQKKELTEDEINDIDEEMLHQYQVVEEEEEEEEVTNPIKMNSRRLSAMKKKDYTPTKCPPSTFSSLKNLYEKNS